MCVFGIIIWIKIIRAKVWKPVRNKNKISIFRKEVQVSLIYPLVTRMLLSFQKMKRYLFHLFFKYQRRIRNRRIRLCMKTLGRQYISIIYYTLPNIQSNIINIKICNNCHPVNTKTWKPYTFWKLRRSCFKRYVGGEGIVCKRHLLNVRC